MQNRDDGSPILNVQSGSLAKPQPLLRQSEQGLGLESIFSSEDRTFGLVMGKHYSRPNVANWYSNDLEQALNGLQLTPPPVLVQSSRSGTCANLGRMLLTTRISWNTY